MEKKYQIPGSFDLSEDNLCAFHDPQSFERIVIEKNPDGGVRILANAKGWEYLAKICIEMSVLSHLDPLFHIHRSSEFKQSESPEMDAIGLYQLP